MLYLLLTEAASIERGLPSNIHLSRQRRALLIPDNGYLSRNHLILKGSKVTLGDKLLNRRDGPGKRSVPSAVYDFNGKLFNTEGLLEPYQDTLVVRRPYISTDDSGYTSRATAGGNVATDNIVQHELYGKGGPGR